MNYTRRIDTDKAVEMQISSFTGKGGTTEYQVMVSITDPCLSFVEQLQNLLRVYVTVVKEELSNDATAVFRRYFLSDAANQTDSVMEWECESAFCPLSIVQQPPLNGTKIAMWTYLQTGMSVQTYDSGLLEASHNGYRHLWGGGAFNKAANSEYQTRLLLNDYVMQLMGQRCTLASHCVRTWFFVQNVDVNYAGVVKARKEVFITQNLTEKTHYEYGVTFERGTAVTYGDRKQVFISGTASIDNRGEIVYPGDIVKQTERMMENISVLLKEADATTRDITQAISYLRDMADYAVVKKYFEAHYPDLPHLIVLAPVCRPGWLIETECIAVVPTESSFKPL